MTNLSTETNGAKPATAAEVRRLVVPRHTVTEREDAFVVTAFVPGVDRSGLETLVDGDQVVVTARRTWTPPTDWVPVHRETPPADFRLVLEVDRRVDRDKVQAQLTQGVLTLTLGKAEEIKRRKIEILG